jgi:hypothetical protein
LEAVVLKAMAKLPADRQQHVQELYSELKSIEIGDNNIFDELKFLLQIISGRMKAAERRSVILKSLLDGSLTLAVLVSLLLLSMPKFMETANRELERNTRLVKTLEDVIGEAYTPEIPSKMALYHKQMNTIDSLCKADPRQMPISGRFRAAFTLALDKVSDARMHLMNIVKGGFTFASFQEGERCVNTTWKTTGASMKIAAQLLQACDENIERSNQLSSLYLMTQQFSLGIALLLLFALPSLIWRRFCELKSNKTSAADDQLEALAAPRH